MGMLGGFGGMNPSAYVMSPSGGINMPASYQKNNEEDTQYMHNPGWNTNSGIHGMLGSFLHPGFNMNQYSRD